MKRFDPWCQRLFCWPAWPVVLVVTMIPLLSACLCLPASLPGLRGEETPVEGVQPTQTQIGPVATPTATATPTPTYTRPVRPAVAMPTATNTKVVYATWTHVPWTPTSTPKPRPTGTLNVILPTSVPGATPTRTPTSVPSITGWLGAYYANTTLSGSPARIRDDPWVDFNWGTGSPASGLPVDGFSVRWTRDISFDADTYRFFALVDDGVRLWVDGHNVLDAWSDGPLREVSQVYSVSKGTHEIRVEYYDRTGQAAIHIWWSREADAFPDWKGSYYANRSLSGSAKLVRNDAQIDFDWSRDAPAVGLPADDFSVRWTRTVDFPDAVYRFVALADDGIRVSISGQRIIDAWYDSAADRVQITEVALFGPHDVVVEYYEHRDDALIKVAWAPIQPGPARK